jgi:hypothetical protein
MKNMQAESLGLSTARLNCINNLILSYVESNKIAGAITVVSLDTMS